MPEFPERKLVENQSRKALLVLFILYCLNIKLQYLIKMLSLKSKENLKEKNIRSNTWHFFFFGVSLQFIISPINRTLFLVNIGRVRLRTKYMTKRPG